MILLDEERFYFYLINQKKKKEKGKSVVLTNCIFLAHGRSVRE